jgi:hypothetical protein
LPSQAKSVGQLAQVMHSFLNLGDGLVVVVAGREVGAYGARMDRETLQGFVRSAAKTFDSEGYAQGIEQIVRSVDNERARSARQGRNLVLMIIGIPAVAIWWASRRGKKRRAAELAEARTATRDLSTQLASEFEKLDSDFEYAILGESDAAHKKLLQEQRHHMGEAFSTAMKRISDAENLQDFSAAKRDLQAAQAAMQRARNALEGKPVDEGVTPVSAPLPGNDAAGANAFDSNGDVEVPPLGANYQGAQPGYALDFFTSQPVPRDQMVPVDLEINGQRRRVWASRDSAQAALSGEPQIATIPYNGQQRAWFDVPQYNPWSDFGSQMIQMVALNMMINSMMGHHHGWSGGGWGGGGWSGSDYGGGRDYGWNDSSNGIGVSRDDEYSARRDDGYDQRMSEASRDAGAASLDSPLHGGTGWFNSTPGDEGASASLDVFGGGGFSGGDSS